MDQNKFDKIIKAKTEQGFEAFDMEAMWSKVEPQLPKKRKRKFILWWLGSGLLVLLMGYFINATLITSIDNDQGVATSSIASELQVDAIEIKDGREADKSILKPVLDVTVEGLKQEEVKSDDPIITTTTGVVVKGVANVNEPRVKPSISNFNVNKSNRLSSGLQVVAADENKQETTISNDFDVEPSIQKALAFELGSESSLNELEKESVKKDFELEFSTLPLLKISSLTPNTSLLLEVEAFPYEYLSDDEIKRPSSIEFGAGYFLNSRRMAYSGNDVSILERVNTEKGLDAQSIYFKYNLPIDKSWSVSFGFEYQNIWDKRNHIYQQTGDSIYLTDEVIAREVSSDGLIEVKGDIKVGSKRYLNIDAFHRYESIGLPVSLNYQTNRSKINWAFGFGLTPSIVVTRFGQIYHQDEEYDISGDVKNIYSNSVAFDAFGEAGIIYDWSNRWSMTFNLKGEMPLTTLYNNNYNLIDKHFLLGAQIGVRYKL